MGTRKEWQRRLTVLGPMFADAEQALGAALPRRFPDPDALTALVHGRARTRGGQPVRFVSANDGRTSALQYEQRVFETGLVATRPEDWHDLFNALSWALFPQTKAALNAGHYRERDAAGRSRRRDALTLVDEAGLVCAVTEQTYEALNDRHDWRALFIERRAAWHRWIQPILVGHGLMAQCLEPHIGLTAKAIYVPVPRDFAVLPARRRLALVDGWLAERIERLESPRELLPLPVLGIPEWHAANADPAFYDDTDYFRPRRR
ncbi:MAG: DUF3025 domain-containing protein [Pseudomonadota bacterium]